MRDIKFRQWYQNHMYYFGFIKDRNDCISFTCAQNNRLDKYPVMQFTGLQDKNGVDIYEGDVIKDDEGFNHEVTFNEFGIDLSGCYDSGDYYMGKIPGTFPWDKFEVIGNIHENPELLEK